MAMTGAGNVRAGGAFVEIGLTGIQQSLRKFRRFNSSITAIARRIGTGIFAAGAGMATAFIPFVKAASNAEETIAKFGAVFKETAPEVEKWVKQMNAAYGIGEISLKGWLNTLQDSFVPMGFARSDASKLSRTMTQLAVDIASFNPAANGPEDVMADIQSAIAGMPRPLRKYGVFISQARIENELLSKGLIQQGQEISETMKAWGTLSLVMKDTADAQGDAARTSNSWKNTMMRLKESFTDFLEAGGKPLIKLLQPLVDRMTRVINKITEFVNKNPAIVTGLAKLAGWLASIGALLIAGPWAWYLSIIGAIGTQVKSLGDAIQNLGNMISPGFGEALQKIYDGFGKIVSQIGKMFMTMIDFVVNYLADALKSGMAKVLGTMGTELKKTADSMWATNPLKKMFAGLGGSFLNMRKRLDESAKSNLTKRVGAGLKLGLQTQGLKESIRGLTGLNIPVADPSKRPPLAMPQIDMGQYSSPTKQAETLANAIPDTPLMEGVTGFMGSRNARELMGFSAGNLQKDQLTVQRTMAETLSAIERNTQGGMAATYA